jgi:hypothetical protein
MTHFTMHPIDRLVRRLQRARAPSRALDLRVARAIYGDEVVLCPETQGHIIIRITRDSIHRREVPLYTADRRRIGVAVRLLRRKRDELQRLAVRPQVTYREAA